MTHIFILKCVYNCPVGLPPQHFPASCQNKTFFYFSAKWSNLNHVWVCLRYTCSHIGTSSCKTTGFDHHYGAFISYLVGWLVEGIFTSCMLILHYSGWGISLMFNSVCNHPQRRVLSTATGNIASTNNVRSSNFSKSSYSTKSSFLVLTGECNTEE